MDKLIINYTPTGMVPMKKDNPNVPLSIQEIIEDVHQADELGITMVHLHARHPQTFEPEYRIEVYGPILEGVRKYCPKMVCGLSLSGRVFPDFEKRAEPLQLLPDLASLTLSSLNFIQGASLNSPEMIHKLLEEMNNYGVIPELEVFDLGMMNYASYLINRGLLKDPLYFNFIFGNIASMQLNFSHLAAITSNLTDEMFYSFGGIGSYQLRTHYMAIASGAGVRVGLEDNLYYDQDRSVAATNQSLLKRIHNLAEIAEREVMKPEDLGRFGFYNSLRTEALK